MPYTTDTGNLSGLTHIDETGRPAMVDVSTKEPTKRTATANGCIDIPEIAYELLTYSRLPDLTGSSALQEANLGGLERRKEKARSKGDVLTVAQLAGIMGSKRTSDLIPLCHPLALSQVKVVLTIETQPHSPSPSIAEGEDIPSTPRRTIFCQATVTCEGKTGVEMEALTAVSVSLLTVWDMLKAVAGKDMVIRDIYVSNKTGGKSGDFTRK